MRVIEIKVPPWQGREVVCIACQSKLLIDQITDVTILHLTAKDPKAAVFRVLCPVCDSEGDYSPEDFNNPANPVQETLTNQIEQEQEQE